MKSRIARTEAGPVEYTLTGSGPVVLVCHGTSSSCFWNDLTDPLLESGFSVLTPSRPGYGRTPLSVGRSAAQAAQALAGLLDDLKIETCAVIAVSGGGPTGLALTAQCPEKVKRLVLAAAVTHPEDRPNEPGYQAQSAFYGPFHGVTWAMLGLMSRLSPRQMARQTLVIFSRHDPDVGLSKLTAQDIAKIVRFYQGRSSRKGALSDARHTVGVDLLQSIRQPVLVVHSREDASVPYQHAEWAMDHIPQAQLCLAGITGHFFWIDPTFGQISQRLTAFLKEPELIRY